ncbi:hypothetical protein GWN63_00015, partial [Candidatus Bathyarchaeota archaeon]|nr:hypothetical protein [Candidatus Bathyarchaeota archaeon]NIR16048.1 hypothetical protein [Desulfobacterales bacterium]NIU80627.1 hypothetical protein [Candidatus Bathyarchaeota archaeon]NIV67470.1 hypothetical protein [Candidatus Bathyarchaeota archaeon]NIW33943.1 hypothetical protein [Candidatus Bathyarchaeota archaeon]
RCTLICADNTGGLGDLRGAFSGTNVQNTATLDRFFTTINLDYLDEDHEKEIIHKKHPELTDEYIGKMVQFANLIRTSYNQEELDHTMSPRTLLNWAKKTLMYQDRDRALKVSFLKKFNDDAQISCIQ